MTALGVSDRTVANESDFRWACANVATITWRNLVTIVRTPELLFFSTLQPIMFVLLFRYVFAGSIGGLRGYSYVNYLMPGIFVQTVAFGSIISAVGMAEDLQKGVIERFRALPMARPAVVMGRTISDLARGFLSVVLMVGLGFAVGFRVQTNPFAFLAGIGVLLLFAWALSWGFAFVGLIARSPETAQLATIPILFPFTFASSAFVPVQTMPGWLQAFAKNQPVSEVVNACRALMVGGPTERPLLLALAWSLGLVAVLAPLAVRRYARTA